MKVAVYDRWWPTAGGGEKFAGGIAEVLSAHHDVTILAHEPLDLDHLSERLQLDLSRVSVREIEVGELPVEEASADFDFFVNASYTSTAIPRSAGSLYVVHFPSPPPADPPGWKTKAKRYLRPALAAPEVDLRMARGFHPEEMIGSHRAQWTNGDATIEVRLPPGREEWVTVGFGKFLGEGLPAVVATLEVDGERALSIALRGRDTRFELPVNKMAVPVRGHDDGSPVQLRITSEVHVPKEIFGTNDDRRLGVPITGVQVGSGPKALLRERYPSLAGQLPGLEWVHSYDKIVSNSEYTKAWVEKWWGIDTDVLNPPVTLQTRQPKEKIILNVGRFFAPEHGHCKKQLDMVRAMRALQWRGRSDGWVLHLVGGVSKADRPYLEKVQREAADLPVELHIGATGAEVRDLYGRASIYWHATGLGEDPETQPDRFEHFGITTAEAMSAGAVPIVIRAAGQKEVVEHGVSGLNWEPLVQLVCFTEDLILDDARREEMSHAAETRAQRYGMPAFSKRLEGIVASIQGARV